MGSAPVKPMRQVDADRQLGQLGRLEAAGAGYDGGASSGSNYGPENADLIVVPNTATRTKRTYDTFYDTWGPGWRWRWARPTVYVNEFREGTLVVDAFDNKAKTAVWHGVASDVLADKPSENAEKVDKAVRELIQQYPS